MTTAALKAMVATPQVRARDEPRIRTRALFAAGFGLLILLEVYIGFWTAAPADLRLHYLWRALYWAAIDVGTWWVCVSIADAANRQPMPGADPYVLAALAACCVTPFLHWATETWYFEPPMPGRPPRDLFVAVWQVSIVGAWRITLLTAGYDFRLRSVADAALLARARLDREVFSRKAIQSQLQALQGKVDPNLLFETLDDIEQACEWDAARADRMLECLIAFLRAALPHGDEEATTVAQEISLAEAYLALAAARNEGLDYTFECDEKARHAAIAPMLLTPLVGHAVRAMRNGTGRVAIACTLDTQSVRIVLAAHGAEANAVWQSADEVADVAKRLESVYGESASLAVGASGTDNMQIVLQIPLVYAARRHR